VDPLALESALDDEMTALADVAPEEVNRAIRLMEASQLDELQKVDERADQLSMFTCLFDDPGRINTELGRIRGVTADGVRELAAEHLGGHRAATLVYVPEGGAV
jgi:predicted Zn-dependent peptidase